jgi:hypothetical protein
VVPNRPLPIDGRPLCGPRQVSRLPRLLHSLSALEEKSPEVLPAVAAAATMQENVPEAKSSAPPPATTPPVAAPSESVPKQQSVPVVAATVPVEKSTDVSAPDAPPTQSALLPPEEKSSVADVPAEPSAEDVVMTDVGAPPAAAETLPPLGSQYRDVRLSEAERPAGFQHVRKTLTGETLELTALRYNGESYAPLQRGCLLCHQYN